MITHYLEGLRSNHGTDQTYPEGLRLESPVEKNRWLVIFKCDTDVADFCADRSGQNPKQLIAENRHVFLEQRPAGRHRYAEAEGEAGE